MKINIKNIRIKNICAILFIFLFLSCNNSGESEVGKLQKEKDFLYSLANLGNDFSNIFTSFGDTIGSVLGFNAETKKSEVADYFKKIQTTIEGTKTAFEKLVADMKAANNPNADAVEKEVEKLVSEKLNNIIEGSKIAFGAIDSDDDLLGNIAAVSGAEAVGSEVTKLIDGVKNIVKTGTDEAGKLFASDNAGTASNAKKSADILQAMIGSEPIAAAKLLKAKDGTIAGAIALRAMTKGGKFANATSSDGDYVAAVKGVAVGAVTKALNTLTIAIRKTIDEGLNKKVKDVMNITPETIPVTYDRNTPETKK
ncbi:variable large family protein (plasmid) [Borrelia coriaceae]|uniref:Variable large protein n=1 Tax=Borrelia coriaceae ATCC 43381 TaxID=1408429 RepID=W5SX15_9SPIR|nr:variable large family protein [Borrelia coriaceae]AHH11248.1 Variable outer membrane protein [Borrelia coriaceae ATCC 43381]UPA17440.1 variable large family protein [Borrelia coriaceae]